ncbi:MAG: hypothetical protein JXA57_16180 [Armatimonadetes bacterium]|nr:hypothetical protein [Armatimonadota bacterium]
MTCEEWLRRCGVGERYWDVERAKLREPGPILNYLKLLPENVGEGRGLLLLGPVGVGKTAALALIARESRMRLPAAWYTTTSRLISHLLRGTEMRRETFRVPDYCDTFKAEEREVDPKEWPLLLLDEFGAAYESEYAMAAFEDYLGWRYDRRLATCVASNLTPEQIRGHQHYARMVDRWRETCRVVVIGGESMRSAA